MKKKIEFKEIDKDPIYISINEIMKIIRDKKSN